MVAGATKLERRLKFTVLGLAGILLLLGLPLAWYLGSPLFLNQTVDEAAPTGIVAAQPVSTAPAIAAAPAATAPATGGAAPAAAPTTGGGATGAVPAPAGGAPTPGPATGAVPTPAGSAPAAGAPAPAPAASGALGGRFVDADGSHKGEGRVMIITQADGRRILRFEDFKVTNGPDLYVYLSGHPAPRSTAQLHGAGDFEIARLKGNVGNQNYELPADLDLSQFKSVVIYCKRFTTVFSTAELTGVAAAGGEWATLSPVVGEG